ncbi:hypothetical protein N9X45_06145, partial [Pseudomonadales bacterium]|nr:hypothetical protein [Pseudomonadales bacterium]
TEARFPFDFVFEVSYSLVNGELLMEYNFKNLSEEALPLEFILTLLLMNLLKLFFLQMRN